MAVRPAYVAQNAGSQTFDTVWLDDEVVPEVGLPAGSSGLDWIVIGCVIVTADGRVIVRGETTAGGPGLPGRRAIEFSNKRTRSVHSGMDGPGPFVPEWTDLVRLFRLGGVQEFP
ncbi:hypothetical protein Poly30_09020 [Planctomycetes bacterium Poly30]|uniref:Uncharacterized protein n=1 Tax=Saltatorellus ferox TaxID=2528018 RepID=A0A518EMU2_9BACT|nr:hypothetical protein Poly30_09020 [Planctomycetes bacterium Poly30]